MSDISPIITPYYRTVVDRRPNECSEEADYNYTPYNLFCLKTRLYPFMIQYVGSNVDIEMPTTLINNKMFITVIPVIGTRPIDISNDVRVKLIQYLDQITGIDKDSCLLFSTLNRVTTTSGYLIPVTWMNTILPYISLPESINPFIDQYGIYGDLSKLTEKEYSIVYNQLVSQIIEQIRTMYRLGYVTYAQSISEDWALEPVDTESIVYRPLWNDDRFASDLVSFIQSRIRGERTIKLRIGNNNVDKHFVARELNKYKYEFTVSNGDIIITVDNLDHARIASSLVYSSKSKSIGKVIVVSLTKPSDISYYSAAVNEVLGIKEFVQYTTQGSPRPYVFSCLVPFNIDERSTQIQIRRLYSQYIKGIVEKKD